MAVLFEGCNFPIHKDPEVNCEEWEQEKRLETRL